MENADDLIEMADWLMTEGHNQDALDVLKEFGADGETQRDAFDAILQGAGGLMKGLISACSQPMMHSPHTGTGRLPHGI